VQLGRAAWLFDTAELNPRGAAIYPEIYEAFAKRYQFATLPKAEEIHSGDSAYFKNGRFTHQETIIAVDFELHSDGVVANTRHSTEGADAFLVDVVGWLSEHFGVSYNIEIARRRVHRSELVVSLDPKLDNVAEKLVTFSALVAHVTGKPSLVTGLIVGSQEVPAAFYIERKAGTVALNENNYIAHAWMQTGQHLDLLQKFECIMAD